MPLFACRKCLTVENTALSNYWSATMDGEPALCSACDPDIGAWHGEFPQRSAVGFLVDQDGHLWRSDEQMPRHYKVMGSVDPQSSQDSTQLDGRT